MEFFCKKLFLLSPFFIILISFPSLLFFIIFPYVKSLYEKKFSNASENEHENKEIQSTLTNNLKKQNLFSYDF